MSIKNTLAECSSIAGVFGVYEQDTGVAEAEKICPKSVENLQKNNK